MCECILPFLDMFYALMLICSLSFDSFLLHSCYVACKNCPPILNVNRLLPIPNSTITDAFQHHPASVPPAPSTGRQPSSFALPLPRIPFRRGGGVQVADDSPAARLIWLALWRRRVITILIGPGDFGRPGRSDVTLDLHIAAGPIRRDWWDPPGFTGLPGRWDRRELTGCWSVGIE